MLEEVRIRNLGVIADATLPFGPGLTVVTGETGAGKTMVVAGLTLLFGARSDSTQVTRGAAAADVEGSLVVDPEGPAAERCRDAGGTLDDDRLILARSISAEGRSRATAGGRSVPVGVLADIGETQLTVHGQSSQLALARPGAQRAVLDRFGGAGHAKIRTAYTEAFTAWQDAVRTLADLQRDDAARQREVALLRFGLEQIERAAPQEREDDDIDAEVHRLANADALRQVVATASAAIDGPPEAYDASGADALLGQAGRALADAGVPELDTLAERLAELGVQLRDIAGELSAYGAGISDDPERLGQLMTRKAELKELVRSYSGSGDVAGVLAWAADARDQLQRLDGSAERLEQLAAERDQAAQRAAEAAAALSKARTALARKLQKQINAELASLALGGSRVSVQVTTRPATEGLPALRVGRALAGANESGTDQVRILLAHGADDPGRPIDKGASGGELSRIMLAIEVVLAGTDPVATMVFDEVDTGVGGEAAIEIGRRLAALSRSHQVVVVTHLPQVAAYADQHVKISKRASGGVLTSGIAALGEKERLDELTRMLAGLSDSDSGRAHAAELIAAAEQDKKRAAR
ncbi:DNA repair protein RecN [Cumulibacter manganitolerans]|uniref:DNA repair protein RecN n=1 Tax=Cumulibacter manganitolerans TaxID=1884992 RepID=UPI001295A5AA|nr:DNA repair protein RecN [Cumulibacter manganitolerans]